MSVYISYCAACKEKQNGTRALSTSSKEYFGWCQGCMRHTMVTQFELGPTWEEINRARRRARARGGGRRAGERSHE